MKKYYLSLALLFSLRLTNAQITISQGDFADAFDTVRMSQAVWNPLLDFAATGANYTWDFSELEWQGQYVDTFLSPLFVHPIYNITFSNLSFNPYRSNLSQRVENTLTTFPFLSNIFTNSYNFYYKSQSSYLHKGIGMRVSGFPTSVPMSNPDTLYKFPMEFGNEDSTWSDYTVRIPDLGTFSHQQHRVNKVDGWGTLTTPYGTFDVLRHVTDIRGSDSLYIDTLNAGFKLDNDILREYKWITKNEMGPLLQINTQAGILGQFQNFEFVTKILYRDSVRFTPTGIYNLGKDEISFRIFPNPASNQFTVTSASDIYNSSLIITDVCGRIILSKQMTGNTEYVDAGSWERGVYLVILCAENRQSIRRVVIQ